MSDKNIYSIEDTEVFRALYPAQDMEFDSVEMAILKQVYLVDKSIVNNNLAKKLLENKFIVKNFSNEELDEIRDCFYLIHSSLGRSIHILDDRKVDDLT